MTAKKLERRYVQRVVMGPENMFTKQTLEDEGIDRDGSGKLHFWAMFLQRDNNLDVPQFLQRLGLQEHGVTVGKLPNSMPTNLVNSEPWTLPDLLTLEPPVEA